MWLILFGTAKSIAELADLAFAFWNLLDSNAHSDSFLMLDMNHLQRFHREQSPHFSVISFTTYNLFWSSRLLNGISMFHNLAASPISIVAIHFWPRSLLKAVESYRIVLHCGVMSSLYSFLTRIILPISPNGSSKID